MATVEGLCQQSVGIIDCSSLGIFLPKELNLIAGRTDAGEILVCSF